MNNVLFKIYGGMRKINNTSAHSNFEEQILNDEIEMKSVNSFSLRSQTSIVFQVPAIFSMNAKDIIRFGKHKITMRKSCSFSEISKLTYNKICEFIRTTFCLFFFFLHLRNFT